MSAMLWFHKIQRKTMWLGKREKKVLKVAYSCFLFIFFLFLKRPSKKLIFLIYFFAYPKLLALNIKGFQFRGILILLKRPWSWEFCLRLRGYSSLSSRISFIWVGGKLLLPLYISVATICTFLKWKEQHFSSNSLNDDYLLF